MTSAKVILASQARHINHYKKLKEQNPEMLCKYLQSIKNAKN